MNSGRTVRWRGGRRKHFPGHGLRELVSNQRRNFTLRPVRNWGEAHLARSYHSGRIDLRGEGHSWIACAPRPTATTSSFDATSMPTRTGFFTTPPCCRMVSGPPTLHRRLPSLWMQALGPRRLHGMGEEGGGPIYQNQTSSRLQPSRASPETRLDGWTSRAGYTSLLASNLGTSACATAADRRAG
jgi:hypothetical protein